jgi:hypothetical protein
MSIMDISFNPTSTFTNDWWQERNSDFPSLDQGCDYTNDLNMYSLLEPWNFMSTDQFGGEAYRSPIANLCDDDDYFSNYKHTITPTTEETPGSSTGCTSPSPTPPPILKTKRGRGRPRTTSRKNSQTSTNHNSPISKTTRTPHNQVERKYREGLNSEMERLRLAIPAMARWESASSVPSSASSLKPSKAMLLACAIDYIHEVEKQRDLLLSENRELRR